MFDTVIVGGIIVGVLLFTAFAILVEKLPKWIRQLVLGHYLVSDIVFTMISFMIFPVVGLATLIGASIFCILITGYLMWRRTTQPYIRIETGRPTLLKIVQYNSEDNNK